MMAEPTDELEPLFDYSRVQPLNLVRFDADDYDDDDDDDYVVCVAKKRKISKPVENEKTDVQAVPVVDIEDDDDDDWLPPPPKVSSNAQRMIDEDSTLKELRLKKQELVSFAESAKNLLQTVEESAKREIRNSLQSSMDVIISKKTSKPSDGAKILISVQDKDETKQIRMYMDDNFERIAKTYADNVRCDLKQIVLSFDGDKISLSETPASLGMEDNDIIEVHVKSS